MNWKEYKAQRRGNTQNIQTTSTNSTSSWEEYKKKRREQEEIRRQEALRETQEEVKKQVETKTTKTTVNNSNNKTKEELLKDLQKNTSMSPTEQSKQRIATNSMPLADKIKASQSSLPEGFKPIEHLDNAVVLTPEASRAERKARERAAEVNKAIEDKDYLSVGGFVLEGLAEGARSKVAGIGEAGLGLMALGTKGLEKITPEGKVKDFFEESTNKLLDNQQYLKDNTSYYQNALANTNNNVVKTAGQASNVIGEMLTLSETGAGNVLMGISAGGHAMADNLNADRSNLGRSAITGMAKGGTAYYANKIIGGDFISKGIADKLAVKGISKITANKTAQNILWRAFQIGGEQLEESLEDDVGILIDKVVNGKDLPSSKEYWAQKGETAKITGISTLVLHALGLGGGNFDTTLRDAQISDLNNEIKKASNQEQTQETKVELDKILNNKELPKQSYKYEPNNNEKIDKLRKQASQEFDNSEEAHRFVDMLEKIIVDKDIEIRLDANLKTADGRVANGSYSNGVITINPNSSRTGEFIAIHELTHAIGTKSMMKIVERYRESNAEFNSAVENLLTNYKSTELTEEALSDVSAQLFGNQEFINNIANTNPGFFKKIYNEIKYLWHQFRGYKNQNQFVEDLYYKWTKAYNSKNKLNNSSNQLIETNDKGYKYVKADRQVITGNNPLDWEIQVENYINDTIRQGKDVQVTTENGDILTITKDTSGKAKFRNQITDKKGNTRYLSNKEFLSKLTAETHIDELAQISEKINKNPIPDYKNHKFAKDGFDYRSAYFEDFDGQYYKITMSVGKNGNIDTIYNIGKMDKKNRSKSSLVAQRPSDKNITSNEELTSTNSITSQNNDVNTTTKYSMQESENNSDSFNLKEKQLNIIQKNNPMQDDYHTGIRTVEDIKTLEETLEDSDWQDYDEFNPDLTREDIKNAIKTGKITVYSSYPIKQGTFISPSYMEAESYSENGKVYSKEVDIEDVAWIDPTQGQYAKTNSRYSQNNESWQQHLDKNFKPTGTRTNMKDIGIQNKKIAPLPVQKNTQQTKDKKIIAPLPNNKIDDTIKGELKKKYTRKEVRNRLFKEMQISPEDLNVGNDIKSINYQITDPVRVNEKVFGKELGDKINDATINKTKHNTADKIRWQNKERQEIKDLGIKARSKESAAVQKYGEKQWVNEDGQTLKYGDTELAKEFPDVETQNKIKKAAQVIRNKYDSYIDQINETLVELGYDAIPKRTDYMRHFHELGDIFSQTGVPFNLNDMSAEDLPTDINGLTEHNKPGKNWFASSQKRYGNKTTYDAITGIDGYLEGAGNLIFHTEDIQNYRALSEAIRTQFGQTKGFENLEGLTDAEKQQRIEDIQDNKLSKYVAWLDEQANSLAGKKGAIDRGFERALGRKGYTLLNTLKKQVGSNMTGFNVRSSLTNFISSTMAAAKTNKIALAKGTVSTINNMFHNDGFIEKSDFLTSRFGSDSLSAKTWQKISNAGQIFMTGSDYFTSNLIARSKYFEGLQKGMSEQEALKYSNDFSAKVMGDRSQGATAEGFNSKTLGLFTQFQLEVNNQWQYMIHDTKMDYQQNAKNKGGLKAGATALFQMGQLAAYSYFFNELFESLTGSRAAFDPIEMFKTLFGLDEEDEEKTFDQRIAEAGEMLIDNIPLGNLLTGGGRIPISEALKGTGTLAKKLTNQRNQYGGDITWEDVGEDLLSSLPYWIAPTGYSQGKKTAQGLKTIVNGGEYKINSKGQKELKFPVENKNPETLLKALLFGKYALPTAQEYIKNDFKKLSAKQTKAYEQSGMTYKEYLESIKKK